ncbi:glycoside hydrolase family 79 protein [Baudoinia panamericana UAMH 10762]|uniref:Glycoside hydrolase family 79 protein n=1 Tax=Baudoinia panamericana (strain UAMH 10762) TaxID=717646 RepID=M2LBP7_BAUPA|nr:glycoside hydrolase family 79 protein [Baudoinia panamericana UAMH 10762]EMC91297.1 glycoside hydrolase family 79 protein [Baudoinia panamericana UAMH 10762]
MARMRDVWLALGLAHGSCALWTPNGSSNNVSAVAVSAVAPTGAGVPLPAFVSYSIEFSSFPDFAGNLSSPNTFSNNLLNNLGDLTGTKPFIRVGGNTQDYAVFNSSIAVAEIGIVNPAISPDYPTTLTIGPAYFESYQTWPNTKFIHGFNLGRNSTFAREGLIASVPYACKALQGGRLLHWELGNEPDLFKTSAQGIVRPSNWTEQSYVNEWLNWTRAIKAAMTGPCPDLASSQNYTYYAPSFAGTSNSLDPIRTWEDGLDTDKDIAVITTHNYISGATVPGVTLQGTLMNHTSNVVSIAKQLNESRLLRGLPANLGSNNLPFIMGETNSLYNQGRPGLSNTFGAALWGIDFNLWCATNNISRVHMHQGTNYRYQSWQPVDTNITSKGTKAPYYGNIAVASFLGNIVTSTPSIINLPLPNDEESAYAAYVNGSLARLIVVNMMSYNATDYNSNYTDNYPRPVQQYTFQLPPGNYGAVQLQRLMANGSDAITGITFDGYSFNYELDNGMPVLLGNVTRGETAGVGRNGQLSVDVPFSSAVIVRFAQQSGGNGWSGHGHGHGPWW